MGRIAAGVAGLPFDVVRKRLWYPTASDRRRGLLRTTFLARSRVEREAENLERLASWGVQVPLFVAFGERRVLGVLHDSFLCTRALAARTLEELLRDERDGSARVRALAAFGRLVGRLHARGFVDRDLHLRNVLATEDGSLAKIDSPFGVIVPRWRRRRAIERELFGVRNELRSLATPAELEAFESAR